MSEKPNKKKRTKRAAFQFRMSTAVLLMFVAGGLMWLSFIPITHREMYPPGIRITYGIPLAVCEIWEGVENIGSPVQTRSLGLPLVLDICFGIVILFGVWYVCESRKASSQ